MTQPMTALELFRQGFDTLEIKIALGITEAQALEQVSSQRSAELRLPFPYGHHERNLSVRPSPSPASGRDYFVRPKNQLPDWFEGVVSSTA